MKIESIQTYILRVPLGSQRFYSSQCAFPERKSLLVKITTDDGLIGWGEGGQYGPAEPVAACIDAVLAPQLIGRDPRAPTRIWEELYAATRDFGQGSAYIEAQSAIDIALWDILGRRSACRCTRCSAARSATACRPTPPASTTRERTT
jgi:D-galactarolactone cycloisomerase